MGVTDTIWVIIGLIGLFLGLFVTFLHEAIRYNNAKEEEDRKNAQCPYFIEKEK